MMRGNSSIGLLAMGVPVRKIFFLARIPGTSGIPFSLCFSVGLMPRTIFDRRAVGFFR